MAGTDWAPAAMGKAGMKSNGEKSDARDDRQVELRVLRSSGDVASQPLPRGLISAETVAKNSRFIALLIPLASLPDIRPRIDAIRELHAGAAHVVHAAVVGKSRNSLQFSAGDDGEPKGTAGRPVLEVLKGSGLTNILLAIVRYFGGTKLGTGGLVRAYSDAARAVLTVAPTEPLIETRTVRLEIGYDVHETVRRLIHDAGATVINEQFDTAVQLELVIARDLLCPLLEHVREVSRGAVRIDLEDECG